VKQESATRFSPEVE